MTYSSSSSWAHNNYYYCLLLSLSLSLSPTFILAYSLLTSITLLVPFLASLFLHHVRPCTSYRFYDLSNLTFFMTSSSWCVTMLSSDGVFFFANSSHISEVFQSINLRTKWWLGRWGTKYHQHLTLVRKECTAFSYDVISSEDTWSITSSVLVLFTFLVLLTLVIMCLVDCCWPKFLRAK